MTQEMVVLLGEGMRKDGIPVLYRPWHEEDEEEEEDFRKRCANPGCLKTCCGTSPRT